MNKIYCDLLWAIYEDECGDAVATIWAGVTGPDSFGIRMDVEWLRDSLLPESLSHNVGLQGNLFMEQDWKDL